MTAYWTPVEEVIGLFYDKEANKFIDEGGFIVWNIFDYVTPTDLLMFRQDKEYMLVPRHGSGGKVLVELFYPEEDDTYDYEYGT